MLRDAFEAPHDVAAGRVDRAERDQDAGEDDQREHDAGQQPRVAQLRRGPSLGSRAARRRAAPSRARNANIASRDASASIIARARRDARRCAQPQRTRSRSASSRRASTTRCGTYGRDPPIGARHVFAARAMPASTRGARAAVRREKIRDRRSARNRARRFRPSCRLTSRSFDAASPALVPRAMSSACSILVAEHGDDQHEPEDKPERQDHQCQTALTQAHVDGCVLASRCGFLPAQRTRVRAAVERTPHAAVERWPSG